MSMNVHEMLAAIGAERIEDLFGQIPLALRAGELSGVPEVLSEMEVIQLMSDAAAHDKPVLNFIGAGAYEHHIPVAVWQLAMRGEFCTSCTSYQPKACTARYRSSTNHNA